MLLIVIPRTLIHCLSAPCLQVTGDSGKTAAFFRAMRKFQVVQLARTGKVRACVGAC